ncbi:MAG TPA: hypothetical protein VIM29_04915, partial [Bacillota bacterium]
LNRICYIFIESLKNNTDIIHIIILGHFLKAIARVEREISLMQEYCAYLIADMVSGKVKVQDIEIPDVADEELVIADWDEMEDAEKTIKEAEDEE